MSTGAVHWRRIWARPRNMVRVGVGDDNAIDVMCRAPECVQGAEHNVGCARPPNINQGESVVAINEKGVVRLLRLVGIRTIPLASSCTSAPDFRRPLDAPRRSVALWQVCSHMSCLPEIIWCDPVAVPTTQDGLRCVGMNPVDAWSSGPTAYCHTVVDYALIVRTGPSTGLTARKGQTGHPADPPAQVDRPGCQWPNGRSR